MRQNDSQKTRLPDLDRSRRVFLERVVTQPPTLQPRVRNVTGHSDKQPR